MATKRFKYGRTASPRTQYSMRSMYALGRAIDPLGAPPAKSNDYMAELTKQAGSNLGLMGNDVLGDCLIEGTVVDAADIKGAYKAPYDGPVVRLTCASGKVLTVTPNHAVLTPRGFVCAKRLQKGDNLVGTRRAQISINRPSQNHFNHFPAPVEEIFAAFSVRHNTVRKIMATPVHFHGDGKFVNGNIYVVPANGFLRNKFYPALGKPYAQDEVSATSKLKRSLHRLSAAMQSGLRSLFAATGDIGLSGHGPSLRLAHAGIPQADRLGEAARSVAGRDDGSFHHPFADAEIKTNALYRFSGHVAANRAREVSGLFDATPALSVIQRSRFQASGNHPSRYGLATDAELCANLFQAMPGLVEFDRLINVETDDFKGHVFDLSTDLRWYAANGIINHNCTAADTGHSMMLRSANTGTVIIPSTAEVEAFYSATTGYIPGDPASDQGGDCDSITKYLVSNGFTVGGVVHKADAVGAMDASNLDHVRWAQQLCGHCRLGLNVPGYCQDQFAAGEPWDVDPNEDNTDVDGHDVPLVDYGNYGNGMFGVITWGQFQLVTQRAMLAWVTEAYVELWFDWINTAGTAPSGFNLASLAAQLQGIEEAELEAKEGGTANA